MSVENLQEMLEMQRKFILNQPVGVKINLSGANLSGANLSGANLFRANLFGANLSGANLFRADLSDANLSDADLSDANLFGADLSGADLSRANLSDANLSRANLSGAVLSRANLSGANLSGANLSRAVLSRANLSGAIGNMIEVKSAQFDVWKVVWTRTPNNEDILQIGCQKHSLDKWKRACPKWIEQMDPRANNWWDKYGSLIIQLVEASPAVPHS